MTFFFSKKEESLGEQRHVFILGWLCQHVEVDLVCDIHPAALPCVPSFSSSSAALRLALFLEFIYFYCHWGYHWDSCLQNRSIAPVFYLFHFLPFYLVKQREIKRGRR